MKSEPKPQFEYVDLAVVPNRPKTLSQMLFECPNNKALRIPRSTYTDGRGIGAIVSITTRRTGRKFVTTKDNTNYYVTPIGKNTITGGAEPFVKNVAVKATTKVKHTNKRGHHFRVKLDIKKGEIIRALPNQYTEFLRNIVVRHGMAIISKNAFKSTSARNSFTCIESSNGYAFAGRDRASKFLTMTFDPQNKNTSPFGTVHDAPAENREPAMA